MPTSSLICIGFENRIISLIRLYFSADADFFAIEQSEPCSAQLQVKSGFESEFKKDVEYKVSSNVTVLFQI